MTALVASSRDPLSSFSWPPLRWSPGGRARGLGTRLIASGWGWGTQAGPQLRAAPILPFSSSHGLTRRESVCMRCVCAGVRPLFPPFPTCVASRDALFRPPSFVRFWFLVCGSLLCLHEAAIRLCEARAGAAFRWVSSVWSF